MTNAPTRRVRVTIEADVHRTHGDTLTLAMPGGALYLVDESLPCVTVEDITPARQWSAHDVVQHASAGWTLTRDAAGGWANSLVGGSPDYWTDEKVTRHLADHGAGWGRLVVLRYQAGEQDTAA